MKIKTYCPGMLFGVANHSAVWALDGQLLLKSGQNSVQISPGQAVCILQKSGVTHLRRTSSPSPEIKGNGILFSQTSNETGEVIEFQGFIQETDVLVLGFDLSIIQQTLRPVQDSMNPFIREILFSGNKGWCPSKASHIPALISDRLFADFREPPVSGAASSFWYESRVREVIALYFFHEQQTADNFFCSRHKKISHDRIERTKQFIAAHLDQPFDLKTAAEFVGCSAHYLSRSFSASEGLTIVQYLRRVRIEHAAELLTNGNHNVSEAADVVGYQSLSHFSKAFLQEKGVLPSQFVSDLSRSVDA